MTIDIEVGAVIVRGPDSLLGTIDDLSLTPQQARNAAGGLDSGNPVVAEGLRRAADIAERSAGT